MWDRPSAEEVPLVHCERVAGPPKMCDANSPEGIHVTLAPRRRARRGALACTGTRP